MKVEKTTSIGLWFFGILTIIFIILKLMNYITWSWFWILSPFIIPIIIVVLVFIIYLLLIIISSRKSDKYY